MARAERNFVFSSDIIDVIFSTMHLSLQRAVEQSTNHSLHLFRFCDREILAVFDPPYLLKCVCNLFHNYDMNFGFEVVNGEQLTCTAMWADILKLCRTDDVLYHPLHNVTNAHLNPVAQCARKVSLAAQVLSNTVAAAIDAQLTAGHMDNSFIVIAMFVKEVDDL